MSNASIPGQPVILFAEECDHGSVREDNQDSVLHMRLDVGDLIIVADGVGTYSGGAIASRMVVESFCTYLASLPSYYPAGDALREAAKLANEKIITAARAPGSQHMRMSSTVVVALLRQDAEGTQAWVGHVGDSRAYLLRASRLYRLTTDHSAAQSLLSRSLISAQEAVNHPDAAVLTRSLGHQSEVEIDIEQHTLGVGDTLLLCSDGLWGAVPDSDIERTASDLGISVESAARKLLGQAKAAGGGNIGMEMARILAPLADAHAGADRKHPLYKWIIAVFVLTIACAGAMAYYLLSPRRIF